MSEVKLWFIAGKVLQFLRSHHREPYSIRVMAGEMGSADSDVKEATDLLMEMGSIELHRTRAARINYVARSVR